MSHDVHDELGRRNRQLPNKDASRYQTTKIVVQKVSSKLSMCSLVVTDVGGHRLTDTRLAWVMVEHTDAVGRQLPPMALIAKGLQAMLEVSLREHKA